MAGLVRNVEELRTASAGNEAFFKAGLKSIEELGGKEVPSGTIASIMRSVSAANIGAVKKLSGSSSGVAIHKAVEQFMHLQEDIMVSSGAEETFKGADERVVMCDFIANLVVAKCGRSAGAKIQAALGG